MATYANDIQQTTIPLYTFSCMQDAVTGGDGLLLFTVCVFFLFSRSRECVIELSSFSPPPALNGKKKEISNIRDRLLRGFSVCPVRFSFFFCSLHFYHQLKREKKKKLPVSLASVNSRCQQHGAIHPSILFLFVSFISPPHHAYTAQT